MPLLEAFTLKRGRFFVAVYLFLNICVGGVVIVLVTTIDKNRLGHQQNNVLNFKAGDFKRHLDELYTSMKEQHKISHDKTLVESNTNEPSSEFLSLLKPVCQFSGLDFQDTNKGLKQNTKKRVVRNWASSKGTERSHIWNGMTYTNGSISVPASGTYHFYSHVKFYVEDNKAISPIRQFYHAIVRYNAKSGQQELVASNVLSECREGINGGAHLEYPSELSCLVYLNAGDDIRIKLNHSELLIHDIDWHNFGAYLI